MNKVEITQEELKDCFNEVLNGMGGMATGIQSDIERVDELGIDSVEFTFEEISDLLKKYNDFFKAYMAIPDLENMVLEKKFKKIGEGK